jgi:tetratricopeptide (TPR) repeat protein
MSVELLKQICQSHDTPAYLVAQTGAYLIDSNPAEAESYYRRALGIDPNAVYARLGYAETLLRLKRVDEARQQARAAQEIAPDLPAVKAMLERLAKMP